MKILFVTDKLQGGGSRGGRGRGGGRDGGVSTKELSLKSTVTGTSSFLSCCQAGRRVSSRARLLVKTIAGRGWSWWHHGGGRALGRKALCWSLLSEVV